MITPNEPTSGGTPDRRSTAAVADTPYARARRLDFDKKKQYGAVVALFHARAAQDADAPTEFFERAHGIVRYLQATQQALGRMPGREFFNDPAEVFVSDLLHSIEQQLAARTKNEAEQSA